MAIAPRREDLSRPRAGKSTRLPRGTSTPCRPSQTSGGGLGGPRTRLDLPSLWRGLGPQPRRYCRESGVRQAGPNPSRGGRCQGPRGAGGGRSGVRLIRSDEDRSNRPGDVTSGFRGEAQGITLSTVQGLQKLYGAREVLHGLDLTVRLAGDL